ncbi:hypothetical protein AWN76_015115 [Rhodothermaceae bacterium RA]|nr:hypothetical protein AWN76_015115 [Rhodothermaceae bacterium RA]
MVSALIPSLADNPMKHSALMLAVLALASLLPAQAQTYRSEATASSFLNGFGEALTIGADAIFVGESQTPAQPGVVYVYRRTDGGAWAEQARLAASDGTPGDAFGHALSLDGTRLLVGAPNRADGQGGAYIFEWDEATGAWLETARLALPADTTAARMGTAVALSGDVALVGAAGDGDGTGAVYAFRYDAGGTWLADGTLVGSGVQPGDRFGVALALEDGTALIGAPDQGSGAVYVFRHDEAAGAWTETALLFGNGTDDGDRFGEAIALHDGLALIGAPRHGTGAAFAFAHDPDTDGWTGQGILRPFDGTRQDRFGVAVALTDDEAWVGAPYAARMDGRVYRFTREDGEWTGSTKLAHEADAHRQRFGGQLAVRGALAAITLPGADYGAGRVAVFERTADGWTEQTVLAGPIRGFDPITGTRVHCLDGEAAQFACQRVDLVSFLPVSAIGGGRGVMVNDIWGWTDPETGKEYALVGRMDGTSFVDVTDPANPVYIGNLPKTEGSPGAVWRDIKVYQNHAFIVADASGAHGMQVFDLTQLRDFDGTPKTFAPETTYDRIHSAHNIVINEESGFAYTVGNSSGGETCGGGLHMIDIRDPKNPTFAGCFADAETGRAGTGYTHDAQCVIYRGPDADHQGKEICFGANETALSIADVTDKANPVALSRAAYPNVAYTHQGWLTEDHRYFFVNDELDEIGGNVTNTRTLIWDVSDLDDPQLVKEYLLSTQASDHNLYIRGNLMYQSNYLTGLRVLDVTDPANPVEVGYFDTVPYGSDGPGFGGSWSNYPFFPSGTIAVTSMSEGLFLLKKNDVDI